MCECVNEHLYPFLCVQFERIRKGSKPYTGSVNCELWHPYHFSKEWKKGPENFFKNEASPASLLPVYVEVPRSTFLRCSGCRSLPGCQLFPAIHSRILATWSWSVLRLSSLSTQCMLLLAGHRTHLYSVSIQPMHLACLGIDTLR